MYWDRNTDRHPIKFIVCVSLRVGCLTVVTLRVLKERFYFRDPTLTHLLRY